MLPGIYGERLKLRPYLNKNVYLNLSEQKMLPKNYPSRIKDWKNGLKINAGWGNYGEYILGLNHDLHSRGGGFVNYNARGVRKNPLMEEDKSSSLFKFKVSGGRRGNRYGCKAKGSTYQNDVNSLKTLYRAGADAYLVWGSTLKTELDGSYASLKGPNLDSSRGNLKFNVETPLKDYHHLSADILVERIEMAEELNEGAEFKINYLNEVYRDTAFSAGAGYGDEFLYDIMASVGTGDYSFTGYFQKSRQRKKFDNLISAYPYFVLDKFYKYPVKNKAGLSIKNQIGDGYEAGLTLSRSGCSNYLYFIKQDRGEVNLRNFAEDVIVTEAELIFKSDFFKIGYIYKQSDKDLPDIYNELYADFTIGLLTGLSLEANLNCVEKHEQYLDESGSSRSEVDPYANINAALSYNINSDFNIKGGLENILAADIVSTGR
ncbi:MAG: hypothetical protein U9R36_06965, partial [Elusimicrobiota bacterium]|nr:hypothetical protein [Elusimicrobiota bacterium]